jgi:AraC-like DNA-binding protein
VRDTLGTPPSELDDLLRQAQVICISGLSLRFGGDGPETSVISGDFAFEDSRTHPLFRMLPPFIVLHGQDEGLDTTLSLLSREAMAARPGMTAVLDRLCDILFIQSIRGWVSAGGNGDGWPLAVRDPAIDEAIDLIQRFPAQPWTVESLAQRVALSRSTFAERFRRLSGETPMEYLSRWRMHRAGQLLREGSESVAMIAERVGYESEAAFAKAFKRTVGSTPGAYRRA